jgi:HlyD family secretion protein
MSRKTLIVVALLAVAGAIAAFVVAERGSGGLPVRVAAVAPGPVREYVEEPAKTRLPLTYPITMPYEGLVGPIALEEGTRVRAGQVVARIAPEDLKNRLDEADAAVARLDASLRENADTTIERTAHTQTLRLLESIDRTVEAAEQRVRSADARLRLADKELERHRSLVGRNAASAQELNRAETEQVQADVALREARLTWRAAEAIRAAAALMPPLVEQYIARKALRGDVLAQERAEARARRAQAALEQRRGTLTSPVDGVVLRRESTGERRLAAGALLLEIGRLEDLEVEADVLTQDALRIEPGQAVELLSPTTDAVIAYGQVRTAFPAGFTKVSSLGVEQQRVRVITAFDSESLNRLRAQERLGVGYQLRARIITAEAPRTSRVPRSAVFKAPDGRWNAYGVRDGIARRTPVEVGLANDDWVEITRGLSEGDTVVDAPEADVTDGSRVRPLADTP